MTWDTSRSHVNGEQARARLRATLADGGTVVGAGAGTGLSAKCAEAGGADLIIIYNSGRYRMAGRGSLAGLMPYGDANAIVLEMAAEVLPVVRETPVLAGVCGTDPFRLMDRFLRQIEDAGFAGVQNFPTVGLIDGVFRANLEETGMSYAQEVEMIGLAAERGLLTAPYVFDVASAEAMTRAGADVLVPHMGLTTKGSVGAQTAKTLDDCVALIQEMRDAAVAINPDVIVLCHGGPIAEPDDAQYVLARTRGVVGFFGASSMERLPTEIALTENMRRFKAVRAGS
jgi:predicted TIM-barrel enzyme